LAGQVYNIGSGVSYKMSDILNKLLSLSKAQRLRLKVDKSLFRPVDNPDLVCDATQV
jgi:UDP-glucose 4-epimerase